MGMGVEFSAQKPCFMFRSLGAYAAGPDSTARLDPNNCNTKNQEVCEYPPAPSGLTKLPFIGNTRLDKWYGLAFSVSIAVGFNKQTDKWDGDVTDWPAALGFSHKPIYGVNGSVCRICKSDPCEYSDDAREQAFYD